MSPHLYLVITWNSIAGRQVGDSKSFRRFPTSMVGSARPVSSVLMKCVPAGAANIALHSRIGPTGRIILRRCLDVIQVFERWLAVTAGFQIHRALLEPMIAFVPPGAK